MFPALRSAGRADLDRLLPHVQMFWQLEKLPFEASDVRGALEHLLEQPSWGRVLLAEAADAIVGYTVLAFGYSLEHGGRDGLIDELYVVPEQRGRGIGTRLIEAASALCRELGLKRLHLEVDHSNPRAEQLYTRLGFAANHRHLLTRKLDLV